MSVREGGAHPRVKGRENTVKNMKSTTITNIHKLVTLKCMAPESVLAKQESKCTFQKYKSEIFFPFLLK